MYTKINSGSRADFAKFLGTSAAAVAAAASPAFASGDSPKQNLFGIIGTAPMVGGGGMSSPFSETKTYSPYSPYSNTEGGAAVYKGPTDEMKKRYIATVKDCQKRFEQIPGWIDGRDWMEIPTELTRKAYELRGSMNALAKGNSAAEDLAKVYYQDLEKLIVSARRKNAGEAQAAYDASLGHLKDYLAAL